MGTNGVCVRVSTNESPSMLIQCSWGGAGDPVVDVVGNVLVAPVEEVDVDGVATVVSVPSDVHDTTNSETNNERASEIDARRTNLWVLIVAR